ncbi:uncharacterized protein LY89DRAFT_707382 [Mollisia scopiformis]|uniref:Mediator of RNA polymerase II transcription subunit 4 n=1 Tax=Mollisia scopiformis TaxID=149040 RepID=A0A194XA35_MOLSC|nr:uncharacterized protein LY89DRAFT_707382 [Mollisia scopiformis]KUJ16999.1 hypothetical protein LY89DRAFT_707382 [Mollisia scopiformis]
MDAIIDKHFERVEKALATLINSISTYNPNPSLANDLVTADAELSQGLEQLTTHQNNHSKLLALRATSSALDTQIRETLTLLVTTRRDLIATPASSFPTNTNPVTTTELLSYARRISKFTLPPTTRQTDHQATSGDAGDNTPKEPQSQTQTNGTTTPVVATNGVISGEQTQATQSQAAPSSAMDIDQSQPVAGDTQTTDTTGVATNSQIWGSFFDAAREGMWVPWPTEETIRRGNLASIQVLLDQGVDPWTFDPEKSAELEADRKRIAEEEDMAREVDKARVDEERRREMERRMSSSGGAGMERREEAPKVFQLETFDDDEDDD